MSSDDIFSKLFSQMISHVNINEGTTPEDVFSVDQEAIEKDLIESFGDMTEEEIENVISKEGLPNFLANNIETMIKQFMPMLTSDVMKNNLSNIVKDCIDLGPENNEKLAQALEEEE